MGKGTRSRSLGQLWLEEDFGHGVGRVHMGAQRGERPFPSPAKVFPPSAAQPGLHRHLPGLLPLAGSFPQFFLLAAIPGLQMLQGALKSKSFYFSLCVCGNSAADPKAALRQSVALHVCVSDINVKPFGLN